jgi:hypothetical protein
MTGVTRPRATRRAGYRVDTVGEMDTEAVSAPVIVALAVQETVEVVQWTATVQEGVQWTVAVEARQTVGAEQPVEVATAGEVVMEAAASEELLIPTQLLVMYIPLYNGSLRDCDRVSRNPHDG